MAERLPVVTGRRLLRALRRDGWYVERTGRHHTLRHPDKAGSVVVPNHPTKELRPGTLNDILTAAGISPERLRELL
jgi:predicted RNA binding protein YcfA (HicA-like mRNA interferase family)